MKLDTIIEEENRLDETGFRNIKKLVKDYKTFEVYFHVDTDGVCTALAAKTYLQGYGLKIVDAHTIQYGAAEHAISKGRIDSMKVLVDFASAKPMMHIHTDHHETQRGVSKETSSAFIHAPSNAGYVSSIISPQDAFPHEDLKLINMVDSADFLKNDISPDQVMNAVFSNNPEISVKRNKLMMGLVVNKLLLAYKNKPNFLSELVMKANPSLVSMYNVIVRLAKKEGYMPPEQLQTAGADYVSKQKEKSKGQGKLSDIKNLKNGESVMIGNILVQYGGGYMSKGGYDRYTPFKNNPEADFLCIAWPMGLVQLSMNPFKPKEYDFHMGDILLKRALSKHKSKIASKDVTLEYLKYSNEKDKNFGDDSIGFTLKDVIASFDPSQVKGVDLEATFGRKLSWKNIIEDLMKRPIKKLSYKQKELLKKIKINVWDLIMSSAGGHKAISNCPNLNFIGKGYVDFIKQLQTDVAKEIQKMVK